MSETEFEKIVENTLNQIKETLIIKGKEYRRNNNPLHNFEVGALKTGLSREKVLDGFLLKHLISVDDMVDDLERLIMPKKEVIEEKFGDILVYTILKKACLLERASSMNI